jgi:hypothetical protein
MRYTFEKLKAEGRRVREMPDQLRLAEAPYGGVLVGNGIALVHVGEQGAFSEQLAALGDVKCNRLAGGRVPEEPNAATIHDVKIGRRRALTKQSLTLFDHARWPLLEQREQPSTPIDRALAHLVATSPSWAG